MASRLFADEQGIPADEGETIDAVLLPPLRAFLEAGGLFTDDDRTRSLLSNLLRARWELRTAMSLF